LKQLKIYVKIDITKPKQVKLHASIWRFKGIIYAVIQVGILVITAYYVNLSWLSIEYEVDYNYGRP